MQSDASFKRTQIADPTEAPYRSHGKLFVTAGYAMYSCSATVVKSANQSVVMTAAHCLYGDDIGGWVDSIAFVPGYENGDRPFGTWWGESAFVTPAWISDETARGDIGAIVMELLSGRDLESLVRKPEEIVRLDRDLHTGQLGDQIDAGPPDFWIGELADGVNRPIHVCFQASDRAAVRAFFDAAVGNPPFIGGKDIRGEGLIGLTRGFMYAGAPRVIASLWQVDDRASAELMKRFYGAMLGEKLRPAAALRAAQVSMSKDPRWRAPHYWAAFTLQGEWK